MCFDALTAYLSESVKIIRGTAKERLQAYFGARIRFFAENPLYLGIFSYAAFQPPAALRHEIAQLRRAFDDLNISVLTELLNSEPLRAGLSVNAIVEDFRMYMDFFNTRFQWGRDDVRSSQSILYSSCKAYETDRLKEYGASRRSRPELHAVTRPKKGTA